MARTTLVKAARKTKNGERPRCEKCGVVIEIGDPYKWVAPRAHRAARGHKRVRCMECPGWKRSELTSSQHLSVIYAAEEDAEEAMSKLTMPDSEEATSDFEDALTDIASTFAEAIREAAESYRESAEAIEDGFGHPTYVSEELTEKADMVDQWADDVDSWLPEPFSGGDIHCAVCGTPESDHEEDPDACEEYDPDVSEFEEWAEGQREALAEVLTENPL